MRCNHITEQEKIGMFNSITSDYIRQIPTVEGVDTEHLPQILSKIYAQILGLRTKYADDVLQFPAEELEEDLSFLGKLSLTLEVYLDSRQFEELSGSISYVAAMAHKLAGKLTEKKDSDLNAYELPSEVVAVLLFIIGHYYADAEETSHQVRWDNIENPVVKNFVSSICYLAQGKLENIISLTNEEQKSRPGLAERAEMLMWKRLTAGVKNLAIALTGEAKEADDSFFISVGGLASYSYDFINKPLCHVYTSFSRLAQLLLRVSKVLQDNATVKIESKAADADGWHDVIRGIAHRRPYLWDNHKDALRRGFLDKGVSSVITFPTGAGKSTLVELKIAQTVLSGGKVAYIVPTHALEYQVVRNMDKLLGIGEKEGVKFDGEFTTLQEEDAPVWVMTPERCTTIMTLDPHRFDDVELVVMDEFHIISSKDKGGDHRSLGAMLCLLTFFLKKPEADYVLISAMVENGEEIANWLEEVTGRICLNLAMPWKPTSQLQGCLMYMQNEIDALEEKLYVEKRRGKTKAPGKKAKEKMLATPYCLFSLKSVWDTQDLKDFYLTPLMDRKLLLAADSNWHVTSNKNTVSMQLAAKFASLGMKSIVFIDKPSIAMSLAKQIQGLNLREAEPSPRDRRLMRGIAMELGGLDYSYITPNMNVAVHHANLLPEERRVMESFFCGKVDVMAATPTLAQGVNLPVDVVIIAGESRYDIELNRPVMISADEILNAAGRAGRAGFSSQGASILVPSHVIGYNGEPLSRDWYAITEEIFAKGDHCLTVDDPINKMLFDVQENGGLVDAIQRNTLLKINNYKDEGERMFGNALFAYRLRQRDREQAIKRRIDRIFEIASGLGEEEVEEPWMKEVAFKTGVDVAIIRSFYKHLEQCDIDAVVDSSVQELIKFYCSWLEKHPDILEQMLVSDVTVKKLRKLLEGAENSPLTKEGIKKLQRILVMYVEGATLFEINSVISGPDNPGLLMEARTFVLKILQMLAYALSTLSMSIYEYAISVGLIRDAVADEVVNFASYLKEGVTSRAMLNYKIKSHLMRVECHKRFTE